jgi:predicted O-methyltransferase YrrM
MKLNTIYNLLQNFDRKKLKQFILYNLSNESVRQGTGTIDVVEYEGLVKLSRIVQEKSPNSMIIEIGALFGLSTQALLEGCITNKVMAIDNFAWNPIGLTKSRHRELFRSNMNYFLRKDMLEIFEGTSSDFFAHKYNDENISMVFIDADHSYEGVRADIENALKVKPLIICGDDYQFEGVRKAVNELFGKRFNLDGELWWVELT